MRRTFLTLAVLGLSLSGCGSSPAPAVAPPTVAPGYTDAVSGVSVRVGRVVSTPTASYFLIAMTNGGKHLFQADASVQFLDSALVEPTSRGTIGACDADTSHGAALEYNTVRAGHTNRGWIRCDYARGSHVVAVFWHNHDIGAYRVPS